MSLDLYIQGPKCDKCGRGEENDLNINVTYNLSKMWHSAYLSDDESMIQIEGMTGTEALTKIEKALQALKLDPEHFKTFNPPNGWGTYEGLIDALEKIRDTCKLFPEHKWIASR